MELKKIEGGCIMLIVEKNKITYRYNSEILTIKPWGKDSLRVQSTKNAEFSGNDWALLPVDDTDVLISQNKNGVSLVNGKIKVDITKSGRITFFNDKGEILLEEYHRSRKAVSYEPGKGTHEFVSALEIEAREFKPILSSGYQLTARFESNPDEKLYGMGQYQQPYLNIKGCELELAHRNSQASVPFLLSSLGYGMLWNNPGIGRASFNKNITTWLAYSSDELDYFICAGDNPKDIIKCYTKATGTVPMMPEYAMGFWQCKLRYQTQEELMNVAREYKRRNLPISVIVVDFFHWTKQGEWKFDLDYWPDPDGMVKDLKEMGIELMVSVWPTVDHTSENYNEMKEKGYLIRTDRGIPLAMDFQGNTIHYDPTNPMAREYLWKIIKKNYYDKGIKIFWLDEAEPEYSYYDFDLYRYHMGPNTKIGNIYPAMYAKTFFDGMKCEGQENILNLVRCAWAGSQRYGALVWSGDIHSSFRSMRDQLAAGLNMGLAGIPWWTTDIGGFHGGNPDDEEFREVFIRWFQFGAFCPVMRLHGNRDPQKAPLGTTGGGKCFSGADNEVWSYGDVAYEICKKYMLLRESMKPYIKQLMHNAHIDGEPVIRPLFYDFYDDDISWQIEDEYMFGENILVAPLLYSGMDKREVYLPEGAKWTNLWTGEEYDGGITITADAPIDIIPIFLRNGFNIDI